MAARCCLSALVVALLLSMQRSSELHSAYLQKVSSTGSADDAAFSLNGLTAGKEDGLAAVVTSQFTDLLGHVHTRMQQTYMGVEIRQAQLVLHERAGGKASLTGYTAHGLSESLNGVKPSSLDPADNIRKAKSLARRMYFAKTPTRSLTYVEADTKLIVYIQSSDGQAVYAHVIKLLMDSRVKEAEPAFIMNALTGEVIELWDNLMDDVQKIGTGPGGNERNGCHRYDDSGLGKMNVTVNGDICTMENDVLKVTSCGNKKKCRLYWKFPDPYAFPCAESDGSDVKKTFYGGCSPVNDLQFFGTKMFEFLAERYNFNPFEERVQLFAHYKKKLINASFKCGPPRAYFGDGHKKKVYPLTCADIVGHEIAHGITCNLSALEYQQQSGGANEAFSDMTGKVLEAYIYGQIQDGWQIGACVSKTGGAFRYMDDPTLNGHSIGHVDDFQVDMNVHYSSGVLNKVFTLLTETQGWNVFYAYDLFLHANAVYWTSVASFQEQGDGVLQSAVGLQYNTTAVIDTFAPVGIFLALP